jgi:hypothetical protein
MESVLTSQMEWVSKIVFYLIVITSIYFLPTIIGLLRIVQKLKYC